MKYKIHVLNTLGRGEAYYISKEEYENLEQLLPFGKEDTWFSVTSTEDDRVFNYNRRHIISVELYTEI